MSIKNLRMTQHLLLAIFIEKKPVFYWPAIEI